MLFGTSGGHHPQSAPLAPQESGQTQIIFDADVHNFEQSVMTRSLQTPVIVDFWAPWCGPCKQLMPVLEKVVSAAGGQVLLAKVNIDENPELVQALRVQSVPTVFAFFQGQPVDAFMGVQPEDKLRTFVQKLVALAKGAQPDALDISETLKAAQEALAQNDVQTAQMMYTQILQQDSLNAPAYVGLVRCFLAENQLSQAEGLVNNAPDAIAKDPAFAQARTALELAQAPQNGSISALEAQVQNNAKDHQARIDLALLLFANGQQERAVDTLLESIEIDRTWEEGAARKELLKLFEAMGHTDPVTVAGRRRLSSILFS